MFSWTPRALRAVGGSVGVRMGPGIRAPGPASGGPLLRLGLVSGVSGLRGHSRGCGAGGLLLGPEKRGCLGALAPSLGGLLSVVLKPAHPQPRGRAGIRSSVSLLSPPVCAAHLRLPKPVLRERRGGPPRGQPAVGQLRPDPSGSGSERALGLRRPGLVLFPLLRKGGAVARVRVPVEHTEGP